MNEIDWNYLLAPLGIVLGWLLNQLGHWLSTRYEDKKIKKKILYNLLETYFIYNRLDISDLLDIVTKKVIVLLPTEEQTEEKNAFLKQFYEGMFKNMFKTNVSTSLNEIEEKYIDAVKALSTVDPILAYQLNGKTKIIENMRVMEDYSKNIEKKYPEDLGEIRDVIDMAQNIIEPKIYKEAISNLEKDIRKIGFSISLYCWLKTRKTLHRIKNRVNEDDMKMMDEMFDKLIHSQT